MTQEARTGSDVRWFAAPEDWDGSLPAALMIDGGRPRDPRALLVPAVARALSRPPGEVALAYPPDGAPTVVAPPGSGLRLSLARRQGFAAIGLARTPIGVDVETVDAAAEVPWNALHPDEQRLLRALPAPERPAASARLWAVKEAYVKALGTGFGREPTGFRVEFIGAAGARVTDPGAGGSVKAATAWSEDGFAAFACVVLASPT